MVEIIINFCINFELPVSLVKSQTISILQNKLFSLNFFARTKTTNASQAQWTKYDWSHTLNSLFFDNKTKRKKGLCYSYRTFHNIITSKPISASSFLLLFFLQNASSKRKFNTCFVLLFVLRFFFCFEFFLWFYR